jgi:hypothetical protein
MSNKLSAAKKIVEEVLIDLMNERIMSECRISIGVQASSSGAMSASPSTAQARPSRPPLERRSKLENNFATMKMIPSIFPKYIPPLIRPVNRDSIPRDFDYAVVTTYLPKRVHAVHVDQEKLTTLKFSDFNLGDRKVYSMIALHKYLTITKGKNPNIVLQQWTHNLAQSTLLDIMKIPHFRRHQEVNTSVRPLFSCYHRGYLWLDRLITVDLILINQITGLSL